MIRHPLDLFSLVVGLLALGGASAWLLLDNGYLEAESLFWLAPVALVVLGVFAVAASLRRDP